MAPRLKKSILYNINNILQSFESPALSTLAADLKLPPLLAFCNRRPAPRTFKSCSHLQLRFSGNNSIASHAFLQQARCMGTATRQGSGNRSAHAQNYKQGLKGSSQQQGMYLIALVVAMVGLTYASVPLYRMFCQATGYGGTVQQGSTVEEKLQKRLTENDTSLEAAAAARNLVVNFNADVSDGMNWKFVPTQRSVKINPGQSTLAFYTAHNLSDKAITGVSTYNVSPQQAGAYFNKIQCFCFEEQKLRPGEKIDMPVFFYIDPEFATDPRMRGIDDLTLSYTFFKVDEEEAEQESETDQRAAVAQ